MIQHNIFNIGKVAITKTMIKLCILFCPLRESKQIQNVSVGGNIESNITTKLL